MKETARSWVRHEFKDHWLADTKDPAAMVGDKCKVYCRACLAAHTARAIEFDEDQAQKNPQYTMRDSDAIEKDRESYMSYVLHVYC